MILTFGPAAARRPCTRVVTLVLMCVTAVDRQGRGAATNAQGMTSLPPMVIVMSPTWPGWAVMNASAAAAWDVVG